MEWKQCRISAPAPRGRRGAAASAGPSASCGRWLVAALGVFALVAPCSAASLQTPAMSSALASKALLTDSARAGGRVVAVGAYGNIVYAQANDKGRVWRQARVPTQRLLTAVTFIDEREGWAGGHDTLILHTTDGGQSWDIQHEDPVPGGDLPKPVLDILFVDRRDGVAVGAFSLLLKTADGGKTWHPVDTAALYAQLEAAEQEPEPNFNAISKLDDGYLIVGELGTLVHYRPGAPAEEVWRILKSPYAGSFFGVNQLSGGEILIYGLRGRVFRSSDQGLSWTAIETGVVANINDSLEVAGGDVILVGAEGTLLRLRKGAAAAEKIPYPGFSGLSSIEGGGSDEVLLFGGAGAQLFKLQ